MRNFGYDVSVKIGWFKLVQETGSCMGSSMFADDSHVSGFGVYCHEKLLLCLWCLLTWFQWKLCPAELNLAMKTLQTIFFCRAFVPQTGRKLLCGTGLTDWLPWHSWSVLWQSACIYIYLRLFACLFTFYTLVPTFVYPVHICSPRFYILVHVYTGT